MKLHTDIQDNILINKDGFVLVDKLRLDTVRSRRIKAKQNTEELIKRWNCHDELVEALTNINEIIMHPSVEADETMPQIAAMQEILNKVKEGKS